MSGSSKKISELTTATVLDGTELIVVVQDSETRQAVVNDLAIFSPVQSVNGFTGNVELAISNIIGVEGIVATGAVSVAIASVSARVDDVSALVSANTVLIDEVSAAIVSVQTYVLAQISVATSGGITDAPSDGTPYAREDANWVSLFAAYDLSFDFGPDTIPSTAVQSVVVARDSLIADNFDGSVGFIVDNPTSVAVFTIRKTVSGSTTTVGTITVSTGGSLTYAFAAPGSPHTVLAGSRVLFEPPSPADATLTGAAFTLAMTRI